MGYKKGVKQTYMFDMSEEPYDDNPLVLKMPTEAQIESTDALLNAFTKAELLEICSMFTPLLKGHSTVKLQKDSGEVVATAEMAAMMKSNAPKADIMHALAIMLSAPENLRLYTDSLSEETKALWRLALVRLYLPLDEVRRVLNITGYLSARESRSSYYYGSGADWNRKELNWFSIAKRKGKAKESWGNYHKDALYLTISPAFHRLFFPIFFSDALADHSLGELPEGEFRVVSGEADAVRGYAIVSAMLASDALTLGSGRYPVAGQKVAMKRLNMQDFGIGETDGLRAALYVQMLTLNYWSETGRRRHRPASIEESVLSIAQNIGSYQHYLPLFIFAHIKGLTQNVTNEHLCCDLAVHDLRLLAAHPRNWVPIRDFYMHSFANVGTTNDTPFPPLVFATRRDDYRTELTNNFTGGYLTVDDYTRHFGNAFHKGLLYALAALGMVEIACTRRPESPVSPYAAISYARLTALGQYALGLNREYKAVQVEEKPLFEVDDQRLIVRDLTGGDNPYLTILQEIARCIGSGRYVVSAQTFLAACSKREDVEVRIKNFRQFVCAKPPHVWKSFFEELLTRCHPLTLNHEDYHIYSLPEDDHHLQRLVATDPQLRQLVIRAEGFRILVRNIDLTKFRSRLKTLGYLL